MRDSWPPFIVPGVFLSAIGVFVLDAFFLPLGVAIWLPYVAVVLASLWLPQAWLVYSTAAACSFLTIAGQFLSAPGVAFWLGAGNRLMAVTIFWFAAIVGLKARRTKELERSNHALQLEIQHRRELESQLLRTQRLESIGVLTGGIAHDFNNLLTPILMAAKILQEDRPEEERRHLLETLQASAERAAELVRKLLAFAGGVGGERTTVQVQDVIQEVQQIVDHTFPKTIAIRARLTDRLPLVLADPTQLSQVLLNLCVNARDAMPSGGTLSLTAETVSVNGEQARVHPGARPGLFVRLAVEDTGCGMAPAVLDKAFDPFFTTKPQGKGSGLGLSTALGIVRSHGGFLHVDSHAGRGSRISVYLPAHACESKKADPQEESVARRGHGELLLIIDDEGPMLQTVKAVLQGRGYRVLTARGGAEALDLFDRNHAEIQGVLLDMMMPDMDGLDVLAKLRERAPNVRILASSGLYAAGRPTETLAVHRIPFLPKPYTDEQLLGALARLLRAPPNIAQ